MELFRALKRKIQKQLIKCTKENVMRQKLIVSFRTENCILSESMSHFVSILIPLWLACIEQVENGEIEEIQAWRCLIPVLGSILIWLFESDNSKTILHNVFLLSNRNTSFEQLSCYPKDYQDQTTGTLAKLPNYFCASMFLGKCKGASMRT